MKGRKEEKNGSFTCFAGKMSACLSVGEQRTSWKFLSSLSAVMNDNHWKCAL